MQENTLLAAARRVFSCTSASHYGNSLISWHCGTTVGPLGGPHMAALGPLWDHWGARTWPHWGHCGTIVGPLVPQWSHSDQLQLESPSSVTLGIPQLRYSWNGLHWNLAKVPACQPVKMAPATRCQTCWLLAKV